jgi:hypothetical protein
VLLKEYEQLSLPWKFGTAKMAMGCNGVRPHIFHSKSELEHFLENHQQYNNCRRMFVQAAGSILVKCLNCWVGNGGNASSGAPEILHASSLDARSAL